MLDLISHVLKYCLKFENWNDTHASLSVHSPEVHKSISSEICSYGSVQEVCGWWIWKFKYIQILPHRPEVRDKMVTNMFKFVRRVAEIGHLRVQICATGGRKYFLRESTSSMVTLFFTFSGCRRNHVKLVVRCCFLSLFTRSDSSWFGENIAAVCGFVLVRYLRLQIHTFCDFLGHIVRTKPRLIFYCYILLWWCFASEMKFRTEVPVDNLP